MVSCVCVKIVRRRRIVAHLLKWGVHGWQWLCWDHSTGHTAPPSFRAAQVVGKTKCFPFLEISFFLSSCCVMMKRDRRVEKPKGQNQIKRVSCLRWAMVWIFFSPINEKFWTKMLRMSQMVSSVVIDNSISPKMSCMCVETKKQGRVVEVWREFSWVWWMIWRLPALFV